MYVKKLNIFYEEFLVLLQLVSVHTTVLTKLCIYYGPNSFNFRAQ